MLFLYRIPYFGPLLRELQSTVEYWRLLRMERHQLLVDRVRGYSIVEGHRIPPTKKEHPPRPPPADLTGLQLVHTPPISD